MIKVYWLDCSPLLDEQEWMRTLSYLDANRRAKTLRLQTTERRAQSAGAGLLLRHLFGDVEYVYGANGKPYLRDRKDCFFSISHSDRYVVCAVADCEVGVDIEPVSPIRPAVLHRCFTDQEREWIGDDPERFARLWTMKEAYMKMTGTGLSVPAKEIEFSLPITSGYDQKNQCFWMYPDFCIPISICAHSSAQLEMIEITIKDLL